MCYAEALKNTEAKEVLVEEVENTYESSEQKDLQPAQSNKKDEDCDGNDFVIYIYSFIVC